jgi:hypothetical protein
VPHVFAKRSLRTGRDPCERGRRTDEIAALRAQKVVA